MSDQPTHEQCATHAEVRSPDGRLGRATYYPQMGGYGSRCVVVREEGDCFDVHVWHDGEFPFDEGSPTLLHHCEGSQFVEFGQFLISLTDPTSPQLAN